MSLGTAPQTVALLVPSISTSTTAQLARFMPEKPVRLQWPSANSSPESCHGPFTTCPSAFGWFMKVQPVSTEDIG